MRYCLQCGSEYRDEIKQCTDCGSKELVQAEQMQGRSQPLPHRVDLRQFVVAGTAEDPLSAEREVQLLQAAGIPAILRARGEERSTTSPVQLRHGGRYSHPRSWWLARPS